ncbi:MAG: hypothetical protein M0R40_00600 [Firmicutes bacterium]|nr:hypothetical protein [Bacillota bacterium]
MFRKKRGINLSHDQQGFIYFTCLTYREQTDEVQRKILNLCTDVAGEYYQALFDVLTTHKSIVEISLNHSVSESNLYRFRKKFYESWR